MDPKAYRLPRHALPRQYDIDLTARLDSDDFGGSVAIQLDLTEQRDSIQLHARDLQLSEARLTLDGQTLAGQVELDQAREIATLSFGRPVEVGPATLTLAFQGRLNKSMEGIYRAQDGPEQVIGTQCEATEARAIFPCFDEPTFKARFAACVTSAADATVLSNGPLLSVTPDEDAGTRTWSFAATKPMSSYLFALVIGDLAATDEEIVAGTPIRVWALKGKEHMGEFAHRYTANLLPWYEDYFGAPYHFDKYDQVAVPGFNGAMENSGLVLFRQGLLLMDLRTASWEEEKLIAVVVAHEFAHMWFGNLVTMQWWDDLWLNEAFAEWVCYKAVGTLTPEYAIWDDFQRDKQRALQTDALDSTHPIYTPVATPAEASEMFDAITYLKGCSVLRMLENFLGHDAFRDGLQSYMREFAERNTVGADLWRKLQEASREPVEAIMESWILQSGYPIVTLALDESGSTPALHVSQRRFFSDPHPAGENSQTWHVPLVIRYRDDAGVHELRRLVPEREASIPLEVTGTLRWCYANADEIGFYRQDLEGKLLNDLLANLDRLTPSEQMGVLGDQWALTRNGTRGISQFLDVLSAMLRSDNYHVLGAAVGHLHSLDGFLADAGDEQALERFRAWVDRAFADKLAALGFEPRPGESRNHAQQRVSIVEAMATIAENREAVTEAERWAEREAADPAAVDPNLAPVFIRAIAQNGDRARFDRFVKLYQARRAAGAPPQETDRYLGALPAFRDPELVSWTLELIDERVIPQESINNTLRSMLAQRHTQLAAWHYIKAHWSGLQEIGAMGIGFLVAATGNLPVSVRDDLVAFFDANLNGMAQMSYARALEAMDQMAEFKARTRDDLVAWFKSK